MLTGLKFIASALGFPPMPTRQVEQVSPKEARPSDAKTIAQSDKTDHPLSNSFLHLSSRDPSLWFTAPADGTFEILVYDMFGLKAEPFKSYRLSIRKASPDFELIAYPLLAPPASNNQSPVYLKSPTLRAQNFPIRVAVDRKDGFEGEVKLEFKDCLPGSIIFPRAFPKGRIPRSFFCGPMPFPETNHGTENIRLPGPPRWMTARLSGPVKWQRSVGQIMTTNPSSRFPKFE